MIYITIYQVNLMGHRSSGSFNGHLEFMLETCFERNGGIILYLSWSHHFIIENLPLTLSNFWQLRKGFLKIRMERS